MVFKRTQKFSAAVAFAGALAMASAAYGDPVNEHDSEGPTPQQEEQYQILQQGIDEAVRRNEAQYRDLRTRYESGDMSREAYDQALDDLNLRLYEPATEAYIRISEHLNRTLTGCTRDGFGLALPVTLTVNQHDILAQIAEMPNGGSSAEILEFTSDLAFAFRSALRNLGPELINTVEVTRTPPAELLGVTHTALANLTETLSETHGVQVRFEPLHPTLVPRQSACRTPRP